MQDKEFQFFDYREMAFSDRPTFVGSKNECILPCRQKGVTRKKGHPFGQPLSLGRN